MGQRGHPGVWPPGQASHSARELGRELPAESSRIRRNGPGVHAHLLPLQRRAWLWARQLPCQPSELQQVSAKHTASGQPVLA